MPNVRMPDGVVVAFPDTMPPEQIKALIAKKFPQAVPPPSAAPQPAAPAQSIGDQLSAGFTSGVNALPIVGPKALEGLENAKAAVQNTVYGNQGSPFFDPSYQAQGQQDVAAKDQAQVEQNPVAATTGTVAGTMLPFAFGGELPVIGKMLGMSGGLAERIGFGALSGSGISAADTLARGGSADDAKAAALTGGTLGALLPPALRGMAGFKNGVVGALRGSAREIDNTASQALKDYSSTMFESAKGSGVKIAPQAYDRMTNDVTAKIAGMGIDEQLHPDTYHLLGALVQRGGKPMSLGELHIVRQIAQDAAMGPVKRDASKAGMVVDAIDDFIHHLKPSEVVGGGQHAQAAATELMQGISLWAKASKTQTIEMAINKAANSASGLENGLRNGFRSILDNPRTSRLFTAEERQLMQNVVRGSVLANLTKLLGRFGFGRGGATNMLGGSIGFGAGNIAGGPIGGILTALAASGARRGSEALTERAAQRALSAVSAGAVAGPESVPKVIAGTARRINQTPVNVPIAPAALPLLTQRRPISITVHGGAR